MPNSVQKGSFHLFKCCCPAEDFLLFYALLNLNDAYQKSSVKEQSIFFKVFLSVFISFCFVLGTDWTFVNLAAFPFSVMLYYLANSV